MNNIEWISLDSRERWLDVLAQFDNADVYHTPGYSEAFLTVSDGEPFLVYFSTDDFRACNIVFKRKINAHKDLYDLSSPYGYGGWLFQGVVSDENVELVLSSYFKSCKSGKIVSEVMRLHPACHFSAAIRNFYSPKEVGSVVLLDISDQNFIWENTPSKSRNMIRKAEKLGVSVKFGGRELLTPKEFQAIYNETMLRSNAANFYFFPHDLHKKFDEELESNFKYFVASLDGDILAVAIITYKNKVMNYHLSGSTSASKGIPAMNLLLFRAALWGAAKGFSCFNLGGGVGAKADNLFKFKKSFTKSSSQPFYLLTKVFDEPCYKRLVQSHTKNNSDLALDYFPEYRAPTVKSF